MKGILFTGPKKICIGDFPIPKPGKGEVLIKMKASAICGSDMHVYRGEEVSWSIDLSKIPGHEPCGVVEKVGEEVDTLNERDRVLVYHFEGCGICSYCLRGDYQYCKNLKIYGGDKNGGDAEFMVAKARCCLKLPDELSFIDGAIIACNAGTSYEAVKRLEISALHTVAIYGLGPVGLTALMITKVTGASTIGIDIIKERVKLAEGLGVDLAVNGSKEKPVEKIMEFTRGEGVDAVIECSGTSIAQKSAFDCIKPYGKVAIVGVTIGELALKPTEQILLKQAIIVGIRMFNVRTYPEIAEFMIKHRVPLEKIVTHKFKIEEAQKAFELFDTGKSGKIIFIF